MKSVEEVRAMATIPRELFGYSRAEVKRRIKTFEAQISDATSALEAARQEIARLEARVEEQEVIIAALRRKIIEVSDGSGNGLTEPIEILIGPVNVLGSIAGLIDDLEAMPHLTPKFRVYRDGFYRVDGTTDNILAVVRWLEAHSETGDVVVQDDAIHVLPKGRMAG
jgi:hypothetical protein